ncbi:LysR substrate-binding domain-containing protein [Mycobacterium sp. OTB74]|uniref:LysR substrate-binding domain-containing protein n=1 Tax=Mycobacterium sp. OTB74 TaxID=1853452 RepID=UPI002474EC4B|nr:LysR substrate-binding domain-containing protein [Mycobacterium sp. OTB74]MDH6243404.1 DNA-binding transcriptional LysR family regulator [Mycobacterium sp. OTB74]
MELRELRAFLAVSEEGGFSAAARRLHISQPALSQAIAGLERQLGVQLLTRQSSGVIPTEAGLTLITEARAVLARHDQAVAALARHTGSPDTALRLGVPIELPTDLLTAPLAALTAAHPDIRVLPRHLSTTAQFEALSRSELDVGLVREHPVGAELDAYLVAREQLGVLVSPQIAASCASPDGIRLDALAGLDWVGFPRSGSPAWYDEIIAIFRSHGVQPGLAEQTVTAAIADVKIAAVAAGGAFALAPPDWSQPIPDTVKWQPLAGHPLIRRTWAVWPAQSHRRDIATFVAGFGGT